MGPWLLWLALQGGGTPGGGPELLPGGRVATPGPAPEIVAATADGGLLLCSDARAEQVVVMEVGPAEAGEAPAMKVVAVAGAEVLGGEPTSVAVHPALPAAFVTVLGRGNERGRVVALDLRPGHRGRRLWDVPVGFHPDSLAVSPDGRWLVVADEAEGCEGARGTISVLDLGRPAAMPPPRPEGRALDPAAVLGDPGRRIEPEFVGMDPEGRLAVVTCQENDAAVVVDLAASPPRLLPVAFRLPPGAGPDGAAVLPWRDPELGAGRLVAFAEEGRKAGDGWRGQAVSLWWLGPDPSFARAVPLGRLDVAAATGRPGRNASPEGVLLLHRADRLLLLVTVERADCLLLADASDPRRPRLLQTMATGPRPEGLCLLPASGADLVVTADEGHDGRRGGLTLAWPVATGALETSGAPAARGQDAGRD